jgi:8-oxo-dGTP diphosphatase
MHLYTCTEWAGELLECNEGELEWIDKRDLYDLTLWEGDRVFLKLLEQDVPFFSLKLVYQGDKLVKTVLDGKVVTP